MKDGREDSEGKEKEKEDAKRERRLEEPVRLACGFRAGEVSFNRGRFKTFRVSLQERTRKFFEASLWDSPYWLSDVSQIFSPFRFFF